MFKQFIDFLLSSIKTSNPIIALLDIFVVAVIFYQVVKFIRNTRAASLIKGIILFVIVMQIADFFEMNSTSYLLKSTLQFGVLALLIMFQPELRKILEQVGRGRVSKIFNTEYFNTSEEFINIILDEICTAAFSLSASRTGALMVFEREIKLGDIISTGTRFDATIRAPLIENIFFPNSPLHDGAIIISNGHISAAGCFLPLSENRDLTTELGTRHRAALGLSEVSDAVILIVSEETSTISVAFSGKFRRGFTKETLKNELLKYLGTSAKKEKKSFRLKVKKQ